MLALCRLASCRPNIAYEKTDLNEYFSRIFSPILAKHQRALYLLLGEHRGETYEHLFAIHRQ